MTTRDDSARGPDANRTAEAKRRSPLWPAALGVLAAVAYANSVGNTALMHHEPDAFSDSVLDNGLLRGSATLPEIFSSKLLLATRGEYRPLGYALLATFASFVGTDAERAWHLLSIGLHLATALALLLLFRALLRTSEAFGLAAAYLTLPLFVPLVNDVNLAFLLWGHLFCGLTLLWFLGYLRSPRWRHLYLLASAVAYAGALLSFCHAAAVLPLLVMVELLHARHGRAAAVALWLGAATMAAAVFAGVSVPVVAAALTIFVVVAAGAVVPARGDYGRLALHVAPFLLLLGGSVALSHEVSPPRIYEVALDLLEGSDLLAPSSADFAVRLALGSSILVPLSVLLAALMPLALLPRKPSFATIGMLGSVVLFCAATLLSNRRYADDVGYWAHVAEQQPDRSSVEVNLAQALLASGEARRAGEILLGLKYASSEALPQAMFDTVGWKLGRVFEALGDDKIAGFYYFRVSEPPAQLWHLKIMKNILREAGEFALRAGYLSCAEHYWAGGLVIDRYDPRLYTLLGRALIYKNFFRAAGRHLDRALELEPGEEVALYHRAFVAEAIGDRGSLSAFERQWKQAKGVEQAIDFGPLRRGFSFERDRMLTWFTADPFYFAKAAKRVDGNPFLLTYDGRTHSFAEVPLVIGSFLLEHEHFDKATGYLEYARHAAPGMPQPVSQLVRAYEKLGRFDEAKKYERMLREMPRAPR